VHKAARVFLIVVSVLNGLAGLICGMLLIVRPDGAFMQMGALLPVIGTFPFANVFFRDFFWIGMVMLLALGVPNATAAVLLVRHHAAQYAVTLASAILLIGWCGFELVYMYNVAAVAYLVVGVISAFASLWLMRRPAGAVSA
jgi:hypothetical protein